MTCCTDRRAHLVPVAEVAAATGFYQAICGRRITATSMVEPDGRPCLLCTAIDERTTTVPRRSRLARILG